MAAVGMATDIGPVRETNQDACGALVAHTALGEVSMAVVCDGVGGLSHGEVASSEVVQAFALWFKEEFCPASPQATAPLQITELESAWTGLLNRVNADLRERGARSGETLATTCTAVLVSGGMYMACQVGDSRLYHVGKGAARQVTRDQTFVALLVAEGKICESEAWTHPDRNIILQAIGAGPDVRPDFYTSKLEPDDVLVLCTDGACMSTGSQPIWAAFADTADTQDDELDSFCRRYLNRCLASGATDNLTVVCLVPNSGEKPAGGTVVVGRDAA